LEFPELEMDEEETYRNKYNAGRFCARRVTLYHEIHHFAYHMKEMVDVFIDQYCPNRNVLDLEDVVATPPWYAFVDKVKQTGQGFKRLMHANMSLVL
jgi:hypothetical protein